LKLFYIGTCSADESCSFEVNRQNFYIGTASCTTRTQQAMRRHRKQHRRSWPEHLRHRPTPAQDIWTVEKITVTSFAWRNLLWFENAQHSYISKRLLKSFQVGARILVNCEVFATNSAVIQLLWIFRGHRAVWPVESDADEHWHTHTLLSVLDGFFCTFGFALRKHACQVLFWDCYPIFWLGSRSLHSNPSISVRKHACQVIFSWSTG
jgi:hypothetical protein